MRFLQEKIKCDNGYAEILPAQHVRCSECRIICKNEPSIVKLSIEGRIIGFVCKECVGYIPKD